MRTLELKIPPLAIMLITAAAMWLASSYAPSLGLAIPGRSAVALALVGLGLAFAGAGVLAFRKAKTTVNPTRPENTSTVVASGVYRFSRNPMYVGMLFVLTGWATMLSHPLAFLCLPAFVLYMNRFQIAPEERALSAHFGDDYDNYLRSVRRWL